MTGSRKIFIIILTVVFVSLIGFLFSQKPKEPSQNMKYQNMKIESPAFKNNQAIPKKYACDGEDINPPFAFSEVPPATKSFVLIVDDPDAPRGTWVHWTLWNITPEIRTIAEDSVPKGAAQGITDFGRPGYGGPCPPMGTHRYFFKLYALDTILMISPSSRAGDLQEAMTGHILAQAELVGLYSRE